MGVSFHLAYALMILLGLALMLVLRPAARYDRGQRRQYLRIQGITLVAALIGSKLAVLVGDGLWPLQPFHEWVDLLISGRSIVGALLFGFVVAEASKPLLGYTLPPNDRFAVILPFSIATGRIGCWLSAAAWRRDGRLPGDVRPRWRPAVPGAAGGDAVPSRRRPHPAHPAAPQAAGRRLFAVYLVAYGAFRFGSEFGGSRPRRSPACPPIMAVPGDGGRRRDRPVPAPRGPPRPRDPRPWSRHER